MGEDETRALLGALYDARLLRDRSEFHIFEDALAALSYVRVPAVLPGLCRAFDDDTGMHEVQWGLVHLAEAQPGYPSALAPCVPPMLGRARGWATLLHYRLLNADEGTRRAYGEALVGLDAPGMDLVRGLLLTVVAEDLARFGTHAAEVLVAAGMPPLVGPGQQPARP